MILHYTTRVPGPPTSFMTTLLAMCLLIFVRDVYRYRYCETVPANGILYAYVLLLEVSDSSSPSDDSSALMWTTVIVAINAAPPRLSLINN